MASVQPRSFGELLRRYRIAAGLTQQELAEQAGLSARAIGALETGDRRSPRKDTVTLLATALHLAPAEHALFVSAAHAPAISRTPHGGAGEVADRAAAPALTSRRARLALVGREDELSALERHLSGDGPPLFVLAGEPGIGKSRLLDEVASRAGEQGWTVLCGGCHRRSGQDPYAPFVGALVHFLSSRSPAQQRLDLHGCGWLVRLLPELAEHAVVPATSWTLPPGQERRLMFAAVARLLANIAGPAGTLLLLDDLHWAGGDALDLLAALVREPGSDSLRIVGAYRDTDIGPRDPLALLLGDLHREELAARMDLPLLSRGEAAALLSELLSGAREDQVALTDVVLHRAGGLPFFLVSWAQEMRTGTIAAEAAVSAVPWSAAEGIRQRVAILPEEGRAVLSAAAIVGRHAPRAVLLAAARAVGQRREADILVGLDAACRARLLGEASDGSYSFSHDLIRETVLADMTGAGRAVLHREVAMTLEALREAKSEARGGAAELAWHFADGDEPERALPYALLAGDQAEAVYAHDEAERHYSLAVTLAHASGDDADEAEALVRRADVRYLQTRFADAHADLLRAAELFQRLGNWERLTWATCERVKSCDALGQARATLPIVEALLWVLVERIAASPPQRDAELAETLQVRAQRAASRLSDRSAARLFLCLTSRMLHLDRYDEVYPFSELTIRHAQVAADKRIESFAYSFRAIAQQAAGDLDGAVASLAAARTMAEAGADLEATFMALLWDGALHNLRAEPRAARVSWSEALEALARLGDVGRRSPMLLLLGYCEYVLGEWREARRRYEEASARVPPRDLATARLAQRALLHLDLLAGKQADGAMEALAEPISPSRLQDPAAALFVLYGLAEVALLEGEADAARDYLRAVLQGPDASHPGVGALYVLLAWAELVLRHANGYDDGHDQEARVALAQAVRDAASRQRRVTSVDLWRVEALLALRHGDWDQAKGALEEALALARAMPYPYAEAKALYVYAQLHVSRGELEPARECYEQALAICGRLGERLYATRIERALVELDADQ